MFIDVRAVSNSFHRVHIDVQVYCGMCGQNPAAGLKMMRVIIAEQFIGASFNIRAKRYQACLKHRFMVCFLIKLSFRDWDPSDSLAFKIVQQAPVEMLAECPFSITALLVYQPLPEVLGWFKTPVCVLTHQHICLRSHTVPVTKAFACLYIIA